LQGLRIPTHYWDSFGEAWPLSTSSRVGYASAPRLASRSRSEFAVEGVSEAHCALIAVIGAKRARRGRGERSERSASPGPYHAAAASEGLPNEPPSA
jgi:hypothetical protein